MALCQNKIGVLLLNLGSPKAPTEHAVRAYLNEFLSDRRIVDLPAWQWKPILHGIILRSRPAQSAKKYQRVWTEQGSPLVSYGEALRHALHEKLLQLRQCSGRSSEDVLKQVFVHFAVRYGEPSTANVLRLMVDCGIQHILVIPLYPQYSSTTTASSIDAVNAWCMQQCFIPELRFVTGYHDRADYIDALKYQVEQHWQTHGRGQCLIMSFHGIPLSVDEAGDPYASQCRQTADLLAQALQMNAQDYKVTFQSRFGRSKWLEPATEPTLRLMAKQGVDSVDVICPGFAADCLETLEEVNMECRQAFLTSGGKKFEYIPCLNANKQCVDLFAALVQQHIQGW